MLINYPLSTKEIQKAICKAEIQKGNLVAENFNYFFTGELDVIAISKAGYVSEFEVKVSRSDFKADSKKAKWQYFERIIVKFIPNYFTYVCPEGLIQEEDIKPYMGLIWVKDTGDLQLIRKPKRIHSYKHDNQKLLTKLLRITNWRNYFGASQLTIKSREILSRNAPEAEIDWNDIAKNVHKNTTYKKQL